MSRYRPAVRDDLRGRRYAACPCPPDTPCVACPLAHPCSCGAAPGRPCMRPSGHRGPLIALHTERVLHSDVDAIVRDAAAVEARLLADRDNPDHRREWVRALRSLQRHPHIWHGRVDAAVIHRLVALASNNDAPRSQQLTLTIT